MNSAIKADTFFFQWIVSSFTELCLKGWITPNNFVIICSAPCWQKVGWSSKSHKSFFGAPQQNRLSRILLNKWSRQWHVLKHKNMKLLQTSVQRNPSLLKPRDLKLIWKHNICAWSQVTSNQFKISGLLKTSAGFPSTCGRVDTDWCLILWWTCPLTCQQHMHGRAELKTFCWNTAGATWNCPLCSSSALLTLKISQFYERKSVVNLLWAITPGPQISKNTKYTLTSRLLTQGGD